MKTRAGEEPDWDWIDPEMTSAGMVSAQGGEEGRVGVGDTRQ